MSYSSYRTSSAPSRGRGFSTRGSFRGRGGGDSGSWNSTSPRGGRGGFSGPSRGRFNWYKEHSSSNFDSRRSYGSGGFASGASAERYSSRGGRTDDSYRRSYRGDVSDYSSRDHSHHRSPESQRKRMRTEHSYVQASSGRRSHEGSYGGGTDYNSRYSYEDKGYGEDRSRGYRDERRSTGSFRDRSREDYPHRKAEQLDSGMPPPSAPRHVSSPRGSFRGRVSSRGSRGMSRLTLARRADAILARKRSMMDSYSVRKRILTSRAQADNLRRLKIQKLRRIRELAAKKDRKDDKENSGKGAEEISEDDDDDDEEEDGELGELDDWDSEVKKEGEEEEEEDDEAAEKSEEKPKVKKEKKVKAEEEREEGEEVDDEEEEAEEEEEEKEGEKSESPKKSEAKNGGVHVTIKQDSDTRAVSDEGKRTTFHGKPFIRLTCPHCFMRCITFKEYSIHLYSSKHINAMRKQSLRLKQTLARMRMTQRQKQRIVEENEATQGSLSSRTRFCPICKLNYRQFKTKHQISDYHRAMKKFLMPYCRVCRIGFKSPMLYENHICSLDHIKREARLKESMRFRERIRDDCSGMEDEDKEVNLDNFMTLDSVGTVDDDGEGEGSEGEGKSKGDKDKKEGEEKKRTETNLGSEYIKKVEVLFCEMCRTYLPRLDQPERALSIHCRSRLHLTRYVRYRDDRRRRREAENQQRKDAKENTDGEKTSEKKKKESAAEKMVDSTTEKDGKDEDVEMKDKEGEEADPDASQEMAGDESGGQGGGDAAEGGEDDQDMEAGMDDKLWADVDKDLGDLLREVEPGNKSSDEDEDSRAEGGRYDRFRYSEKGSTGPHAEGDAPDTTKTAVDGDVEGESEATEDAPAKDSKAENKDETDAQPKKQSPSGGTVSSTPVAVTTN